jgi:hypothetical protein
MPNKIRLRSLGGRNIEQARVADADGRVHQDHQHINRNTRAGDECRQTEISSEPVQ